MIEESQSVEAEAPAWQRDRYNPLPMDPFGSAPQFASRLPGLGGIQPTDDTSYVFATMTVRPAMGPIVFTVHIAHLVASHGTLVFQVVARPGHLRSAPEPVVTRTMAVAELAAQGGTVQLELEGRKNMFYAVTGNIYDETDAIAAGISVTLDRREESDPEWEHSGAGSAARFAKAQLPPLRAQPELVTARAPTMATPISQPMTARQFKERPFGSWMAKLKRPAKATPENWRDAYLLQALQYYGLPIDGGRALGVEASESALTAYLSGAGCSILSATVASPAGAMPTAGPPADDIERTVLDVRAVPEDISEFDFLWSVGVPGTAGREAFPHWLLDCMRCLKLDGMAIHIFDHEGMHAGQYRSIPTGTAFTRAEIERMALSLIAQGQEIAQLSFAADDQRRANHERPIPFGIIARRRR